MANEVTYDSGSFGENVLDSKGNVVRYIERGKGFDIVDILSDTDTSEVYYDVETIRLYEDARFLVAKADVTEGGYKLRAYSKFGLDVNKANERVVADVFQKKEDQFLLGGNAYHLVHSVVGVKECMDAVGQPIMVFAGQHNPVSDSVYIGHFDLEPEGEAEEWFDFVRKEIARQIGISFVVSSAFGAILLGVLKGKVDVDNLIIHLRGDSSSGKTTMLNLGISVFGNPDEKCPNGLISSWNGTRNALLRRLMKTNGVMLGLDEFSMIPEKDVTKLVYSIASGIEKDRLQRDANLQERLTGTFILLSTGEASILNRTNGNIGLAMRVLEMDSKQWTDSAEQSERIKRFVKGNYGHAGEAFGHMLGLWMQKNGEEKLLRLYDAWRAYYCGKCLIQARKERMSGRYALILLGAYFANKFFDMRIDTKELCDFLIGNETENGDDHDSYNDFYNRFVSVIVANADHFIRPEKDASMHTRTGRPAEIPAMKEE